MWVSTVWLGIDHSFFGPPPIIFETMVFHLDTGMADEDVERYATLEQAQQGHQQMVNKWSKVKI